MRNDPNVGKKYGQKKGEPSRNPCGLGIYGKETLKLKEFTAKEHVEVLAKLLRLTPKELKEVLTNPYATCHEHLVANLLKRCIKRADGYIYEKLFDRILGKVPHTIRNDSLSPLQITIVDAEKAKTDRKQENINA